MGEVHVRLQADGVSVEVVRNGEIAAVLWLQLRALWDTPAGTGANERVTVPLGEFMANRTSFARITKAAGVPVRLDDGVRELAVSVRAGASALAGRLDSPVDLTADEVDARLAGTRFTRELREFQERDVGRLLALRHGANFSVPGAGKTTVTMAVYEAERAAGRVQQLLVIAPLSAFGAWDDETVDCFSEPLTLARFGREPIGGAEVVIVNYQRLGTGYDELAAWVRRRPTMAVLDEAHRMKSGWSGIWGTHCLNLAFLAERRDILTGTPAPNIPRDFLALIDYLWPGQGARLLPADVLAARPPADAGLRVSRAIQPLFARTKKREMNLPPVAHHVIEVPLEPLHREIYGALRRRYQGAFSAGHHDQRALLDMGRIVMYLLEAATNPKLLTAGSMEGADPDIFRHPPIVPEPGSPLADLLANYNEYETPGKFQQLAVLLQQNAEQGRKTLVWSNFVRNLLTLRRMFAAYEPALIHGGVPPYAPDGEISRETEIARFRHDGNCMVLLANPAAMSEGISLHRDCHDAIYLDRTFNAGHYLQSIDRIHRLGLESDDETNVTFLISTGTIDQLVDSRVRVKAERLGEMLDDDDLSTIALPNDEDYGPPIDADTEDLAVLFAHLRGDLDEEGEQHGGG